MIIFFIVGLLLGAAAVAFALQNTAIVAVTFLGWQLEGSLSIVLALTILSGILIALLLTLPELISNYFQFRSLKKKYHAIEEELKKQRELTFFAKKQSPTPADISHIEHGAINDNV